MRLFSRQHFLPHLHAMFLFSIPETITIGDNALVERLYSMVIGSGYSGTIDRFQVSLEVTEELKNIICDYYIDKASSLAYNLK